MAVSITYIICAAGQGSRFQKLLPHLPKPCIKLNGSTLLEWSLRSLPLVADDRLIVITQSGDGTKNIIEEKVRKLYPWVTITWKELFEVTRGQLETAYLMAEHCNHTSPIVIYNCDTYFESNTLSHLIEDNSIEGIVPCSQEPGDEWSFCAIDEHDHVIKITEKERISPWASVGFYFFRNSTKFFDRAADTLGKKLSTCTEYYVAPIYQRYITLGEKILIDRVQAFRPMGSPQQIKKYWGISEETLKLTNEKC